jgi:hypothetical protein
MASPHALRHALAVVLLRGVAALDAKACLEWGYPKEGKWQHDDDCCAGEEQAACAAGYRYRKGDVCHEEVECKAFSYECTLCQPGEECDSNYNVETEDGEDLCGNQNFTARAESPRRPPRHRRDACSMAWRCRFLAARPSQRGHVIAEK